MPRAKRIERSTQLGGTLPYPVDGLEKDATIASRLGLEVDSRGYFFMPDSKNPVAFRKKSSTVLAVSTKYPKIVLKVRRVLEKEGGW